MVVVVPPPPTLPADVISLFYVLDELLSRSPILIFYGPSATPTASGNNSRIQAHVFSPAGLQSYPRLTISPSSPLYAAVNCLPREEQGDEICRGLAFSLYKYFAELPQHVKKTWESESSKGPKLRAAPVLFSEAHAAILASRMAKVENVADVIRDVRQALAEQSVSWLDLDVVLPPGAMKEIDNNVRSSAVSELDDDQLLQMRYGEYAELVNLFGEPAFLPTSRLRRAPSHPTGLNRTGTFMKKQKENIRREMCELLDTEESYVSKLDELVNNIAAEFREKARNKGDSSSSPSHEALSSLFPNSLDQIFNTNSAFLEALRQAVEDTENDAILDIESTDDTVHYTSSGPVSADLTGALSLASCLRTWFPKLSDCYVSYTRSHSQFPQVIKSFTKDSNSTFSKRVQDTGEQRLMSMLIEPVQRLPRYNLYIDNIIKQLPVKHPAIQPLLKARDIISEICSQDSTVVSPSRVVAHLCRLIPSWPLSTRPVGRLITAIDAIELSPPYRLDLNRPGTVYCTVLVFADYLVVLGKLNKSSISARGLMALIDGQDLQSPDQKTDELIFRQALDLNSFDVTELDAGRMIQIIPGQVQPAPSRPSSRPGSVSVLTQTKVFYLTGMHEGKAGRFLEDITKARVEGRYTEVERESQKWEVRSAIGNDLTFFVALSEEMVPPPEGRGQPSKIRIRVDPDKFQHSSAASGVEVYVSLSKLKSGLYRLEVAGPNEFNTKDQLTPIEFLPVLSKRCKYNVQCHRPISLRLMDVSEQSSSNEVPE
jgi:RhoGEF domain